MFRLRHLIPVPACLDSDIGAKGTRASYLFLVELLQLTLGFEAIDKQGPSIRCATLVANDKIIATRLILAFYQPQWTCREGDGDATVAIGGIQVAFEDTGGRHIA